MYFKYLSSSVSNDGEITEHVTHSVQVGWVKWWSALRVLSCRRLPTKLKRKFYCTTIRSAMLYGTECWATNKQHASKVSVAVMRMFG